MRSSIGWRVNVGLGLALAILAAISLFSYRVITQLVETIHLEVRSHEILHQFDDLFLQIQNAETGQRGYVITGEESYLEPYRTALQRLGEEFERLRSLAADNPGRLQQLDRLEGLIGDKLDELNATIDLRRSEGFESTLAVIATDRGKRSMDEIRELMQEMDDEEHALLYSREEEATRSTRLATIVLTLLTSLNALMILLAMVVIHRDLKSRDRAEAAIRAANEQLELRVDERTRELARANQDLRSKVERAECAERELKESRDETLSILNQLRLGTVRTGSRGAVTFLSRKAEELLGTVSEDAQGLCWEELLALADEDLARLRAEFEKPAEARSKIAVHCTRKDGHRFWMEVEIHDDPRASGCHILFLYDVSEVYDLRESLNRQSPFAGLVGISKPMQDLYACIREVAMVDSTVLIEGETGTGKELVARAIHDSSRRHDKPFIGVNCGGFTESLLGSQLFGHVRGAFTGAVSDHRGLFEAANGGTLFLDEIGDVPASVQSSLLRVLQEHEITRLGEAEPRRIDVRVMAATHHDLRRDVAGGTFREDLLYRIRVARVRLPPLRERREDIPMLVAWFLEQANRALGREVPEVSDSAMRVLMGHPWPGNVRELKSAVEFACIRSGPVIQPEHLPPEIVERLGIQPTSLPSDPDDRRIAEALAQTGNNRTAAARLLGISRATLYRRLAQTEAKAAGLANDT